MAKKGGLIAGLDIGTTRIKVVVGQVTADGIDVEGVGDHASNGLRKGVIVNVEATVEAIRHAVEEAERMAGCDILSVYASIAGGHIHGINSHGMASLKNRSVTEKDIERAIEGATAVPLPQDREVMHVIPQEYRVDDQCGIKEPLGITGTRFEANAYIVTGLRSCIDNVIKCANRCGLNVNEVVLGPLASAEAVLAPDEKEMGVVLVDIGGGTTDITIYSGGSVVHAASLPIGGNHVTQDIVQGLRTPFVEAEKIKIKHGCALHAMIPKDETIEVPSIGGRKSKGMSRQILAEIIEPRMEEIFDLVKREIAKAGCEDRVASGVVLTGGASALPGSLELAEQVFDYPVTRATLAHGFGGMADLVKEPAWTTAVGLVLYGNHKRQETRVRLSDEGVLGRMKERMSGWFREIF